MKIIERDSWIILHKPTGKYIGSVNMLVCNKVFAHSFVTRKQARVFRDRSCFDKEDCMIIRLGRVKAYELGDIAGAAAYRNFRTWYDTVSDPKYKYGGK